MATSWPDTASTTGPTNTGAVIAARSHAAFGYGAAGVAVAGATAGRAPNGTVRAEDVEVAGSDPGPRREAE